MTQIIEQLTARVRELEEFKANVVKECASIIKHAHKDIAKQLAASQLHAEQLREALNTAAEKFHDYAEFHSMKDRTRDNIEKTERNLDLARMCDKALAIPRDTSALDAYVAKRLHDMACDKGLLRIQVEELTRQRDLAVEAASDAATSLETIQLRSFKKNYLNSKPQMRAFAGVRAKIARDIISTIKESEAMAQGEKK